MDVEAMAEALDDAKRLPGALLLSGVLKAAAALYLVVFTAPGGVFAHGNHKLLFYTYYVILVAIAIFGFMEASVGFCVTCDPAGRRTFGMTILWVSIFPLALVAALGGFAFAFPK